MNGAASATKDASPTPVTALHASRVQNPATACLHQSPIAAKGGFDSGFKLRFRYLPVLKPAPAVATHHTASPAMISWKPLTCLLA